VQANLIWSAVVVVGDGNEAAEVPTEKEMVPVTEEEIIPVTANTLGEWREG